MKLLDSLLLFYQLIVMHIPSFFFFLLFLTAKTDSLLQQVGENSGFIGFSKLLETKFDLLHGEALDAISLYVNSPQHLHFAVEAKIVDNLIHVLSEAASRSLSEGQSQTRPEEIQLKTLVLIANLSSNNEVLEQLSANEKTRELLQDLTTKSEELKAIAQKVLSLLPPPQPTVSETVSE